MDIVLKSRKRVCGYKGTVSSADSEEPMCLCPVNLPDGSGHLICHALSVTESPAPSEGPGCSRRERPHWPLTPNNNTSANGKSKSRKPQE